MKEIIFTLPELKEKLQHKRVTQTIRSKKELSKHKLVIDDEVIVKWRNETIGKATIVLIEATKIKELTEKDAALGGFDSLDNLIKALKRFFGRLGEK